MEIMLHGISILGFFENESQLRFNKENVVKEYMVILRKGVIPGFVIKTTSIGGTNYYVKLIHVRSGNELFTTNSVSVKNYGTYDIISYDGDTIAGDMDADYYQLRLEITIDGVPVIKYSEIFFYDDNLTSLFGLKVSSTDLILAGTDTVPFSNKLLEFYLQYNGHSISNEINEVGVEKPYGNIPIYTTTMIKHKVEINGTPQIYRFLSYLRSLWVNGTITAMINGYENDIYDIEVESDNEVSVDGVMIINMNYKEKDFLLSDNGI